MGPHPTGAVGRSCGAERSGGAPAMTAAARPEFLASETVQRYLASLEHLTLPERDTRLDLLQSFAEFVDRTPNEMVEELFDPTTRKYRRRGFYTDRIREFSAQVPGSWAQQTTRGNVVRSFFIANGYRILPERAPWL
jgi:hypothetical protein